MPEKRAPILSLRAKEAFNGLGTIANVVGWLVMIVVILGVMVRAVMALAHGSLTWEWVAAPFACWVIAWAMKRLGR
jgi:hypothetical protein